MKENQNQAKTKISPSREKRRQISFLCIIMAITAIQTSSSLRYLKGELLTYPSGTQPLTTYIDTQQATPTSKQSIKGTLRTDYEDEKRVKFGVYYRNNDEGSSYKDSLVLEFSAPFRLENTYQNQQILYSSKSSNPNFKLDDDSGLKLYQLETNFYMFTGEQLNKDIKLETLKLQLLLEKKISDNGKGQRSVSYEPTYLNFELTYQVDSSLKVLRITQTR